ncbi:MAG: uroporphyrinogen decarboxylase family protein [Armatimonadota bacterium]
MTSRERVATALAGGEPDRVPFCEIGVDQEIAEQVLGREFPRMPDLETNPRGLQDEIELARRLGKDNICYVLRAPVYTKRARAGAGSPFYTEGLIRSEADLGLIDLPDPQDDHLYESLAEWAANREDLSLWMITRQGLFSAMLSVGMERFCIALLERRGFVETVLDIYCDWAGEVMRRACDLDIDVICSTDDLAGKSGPLISPELFHEVVTPRFQAIAEGVSKPWVLHSDGNVVPLLDDLLSLDIDGLHPNEKGAMDIRWMKREYGDRLCLLGNVDLNLLMMAEPEEIEAEVRGLIRDVAPGGGYILTSGNSLAHYCTLDNIMAMSEAGRRYGTYPIALP